MNQTVMSNKVLYRSKPVKELKGECRCPGDKSVSHRSIMMGSVAKGITRVRGFLEGEDNLATLKAFQRMGIEIVIEKTGDIIVHGKGLYGLEKPGAPLYLGNSGTSIRLLTGLFAAQRFDLCLEGDESLSRRPMKRVTEPLKLMGAKIETSPTGTPPVKIWGGQTLTGIDFVLPVASAQVKSSILLAGLYAHGTTCVTENEPTRDHTERMFQAFQLEVMTEVLDENKEAVCLTGRRRITLQGGQTLLAADIQVPADISSSAFFIVAALIAHKAEIIIKGIGVNPTRTGILPILKAMGAKISLENERIEGGEPVADLIVLSSELVGIDIPRETIPLAIDEFPIVFVAAACAKGITRLRHAEELRVKESDRIAAMAEGLTKLGIETTVYPDGIDIVGGTLKSGRVNSLGDHRIAMAFTVAALRAEGVVEIEDCANVATSFPNFISMARSLGFDITVEVGK